MSPSDQQKAIVSIKLVLETCIAAKDSISNPPSTQEPPSPPLPVLYKDLISLLSLIHGSATKSSLALKPSSPTYSACLTPLKELSDRIAALSHCTNMFSAPAHGATLTKEIVSVVTEIIDAVRALASTFLTIEESGDGSNSEENVYLRTGELHSVIEVARSGDGIPQQNVSAVRRVWHRDSGSLEDGLRELEEMIEDGQSESDPVDKEEDGWDELELEPSKPLSEEELKRTKKVFIVLKLCNLLHKKVISDILSSSSPSPSSSPLIPNSLLDELAPLSSALLSTSDELIYSLDSPQNLESVMRELDSLRGIIGDIQSRLSSLLENSNSSQLVASLEGMSLNENRTNRPRERWFQNCFDQIDRSIQSVVEET